MAASLGKLNPFRYRGYVFDEETGLYYLRSRFYNPGWNRFINADVLITNNLFCYCCNQVSILIDPDGTDEQFFFDYGHPITIPVLFKNDFGVHSRDEKIPRQYFISALIQMTRDPNIGNKPWQYNSTLYYGKADCNGIVRMICKTFYIREAYYSFKLGTKVETVVAGLKLSEPIPISNKNDIPACCILISKDYSHMAVTIGPYEQSKNAIVESALRYGEVRVTKFWKVGEEKDEFYYYCYMSVVDYASPISHTGNRYMTLEDDE